MPRKKNLVKCNFLCTIPNGIIEGSVDVFVDLVLSFNKHIGNVVKLAKLDNGNIAAGDSIIKVTYEASPNDKEVLLFRLKCGNNFVRIRNGETLNGRQFVRIFQKLMEGVDNE